MSAELLVAIISVLVVIVVAIAAKVKISCPRCDGRGGIIIKERS